MDTTATVYFYVSGEWNGAIAWSTYSAFFCGSTDCIPAYYQCNDRCVPTCCYSAPLLVGAAAPTQWSAQVLGRGAATVNGDGSKTVPVTLEITNTGADKDRNIYLRYIMVKKTAVDADPIQVVPDATNHNARYRKIETASSTASAAGPKYYLVKKLDNSTPATPKPGITEINDFTVTAPSGASFVYIDIFAVDPMTGDQNSLVLPRVQVYP